MKRSIYKVIMVALLLVFIAGCQNKAQPNEVQPEVKKTEKILIKAEKSDSINTAGMTKLEEFSADMDMDNAEEKLELYTEAGRNAKGEMMWDDGQDWLLVVRDGEEAYPLLSEFVQLGQVYFTVSNKGVDQKQNITVILPTGASFSVVGYAFDKEKTGFIKEQLYKSEDDCWIYSSIPSY